MWSDTYNGNKDKGAMLLVVKAKILVAAVGLRGYMTVLVVRVRILVAAVGSWSKGSSVLLVVAAPLYHERDVYVVGGTRRG